MAVEMLADDKGPRQLHALTSPLPPSPSEDLDDEEEPDKSSANPFVSISPRFYNTLTTPRWPAREQPNTEGFGVSVVMGTEFVHYGWR